MAVCYKDLGLVNSREMFKKAMAGHYAIPAFNFNNMEQLQAIIQACTENESPVILQVSKGARNYANQTLLRYMAQGAVEYSREISNGKGPVPIVLHLDHGDSFELCKSCIDFGFSSVMIDGSALPYDENVALTKKVVEYAHPRDVTVEGELGVLAGVEDEVSSAESHYTKPEQVVDFVTKTGVDSLAISIIDLADSGLRGFAELFLRNADGCLESSAVFVDDVNFFLRNRRCAVKNDREARQFFFDRLEDIECQRRRNQFASLARKYLGPARDRMKAMYTHKVINVLGSAGHAYDK